MEKQRTLRYMLAMAVGRALREGYPFCQRDVWGRWERRWRDG